MVVVAVALVLLTNNTRKCGSFARLKGKPRILPALEKEGNQQTPLQEIWRKKTFFERSPTINDFIHLTTFLPFRELGR